MVPLYTEPGFYSLWNRWLPAGGVVQLAAPWPKMAMFPPKWDWQEMIDSTEEGSIDLSQFIAPMTRWVHDSKTAPRFIKHLGG